MTLSGAIANLQTKASSMNGIKAAPSEPPESMNVFPFAVSYAAKGNMRLESAGFGTHFHTIITEIHAARQLLPRAVNLAMPYIELFASQIIADPKLGGSVECVNAVRYEFGRLVWGGEEHIGVRFEVDVKIVQG